MDIDETFVGMKYSLSLTSVVVCRPDPPRAGSRAGQKYVTEDTFFKELLPRIGRLCTATNRMHSNDLDICGKKCWYFGSIPKSVIDAFLTSFWT